MLTDIARAIEGPHRPVPEGSRFTLEELRDVRWNRLTEQERGARLNEAQAVLDMLGDQVFHFRVNDGPEQIIRCKSGIYKEAVAAIPALFGIDSYPAKIEIWVPSLLPDYGPYLYGFEREGSAVAQWLERTPGEVVLITS